MKRSTLEKKINIANDLMYYIYKYIDTYINLDELAEEFKINKFYMHKIFKEIFGRNIYETIKAIRLQKAATLLLTNHYSTATEIANTCGYSSLTSFIPAFKERFSMTPKKWRQGGFESYSKELLGSSPNASISTASFDGIQAEIVKMPEMTVYYIRHKGYENNIRPTWQKLNAWIFSSDIQEYTFVSLFHDNPAITPLLECQHVACVVVDGGISPQNTKLPKLTISKGVFAKFDIEGKRGDILKFIHWVYHKWLPKSDYETTTKPSYSIYRKHHHIDKDELFDISFYLPIQ
ncbi:GyrI-like domain-containing protein [Sulfurimonas sp. SAG-AH-194-L11]|nr:GyrI-like domain-containing protein [Sulfurimonas sp. SAG-AH-194-L11]MDF1877052.1 GyrI-like domain-containing protein [Sulfurimonas sp. SAG-AH-194-L11]